MSIQASIRRFINQFGFELYRVSNFPSSNYEQVLPLASYAPWNKDKAFISLYKIISNYTLVDKYRCFELWSLIKQSQKLEKGSIIEIGVWRGGTRALIATHAKNCGIADPIYLCDTFTGVVKSSTEDSDYENSEHNDTSLQLVEDLLIKKLSLDNVKLLQGIFPEDTSHLIESERFRFCHVDVDVYQSAKDIVTWIWDRMVPGGIIVYDDYGFASCDGITKYVEEQIDEKDRLIIHNLNGHAIIIKR
jgi:O-methyltransferase